MGLGVGIQHIQHLKGFGGRRALKFNILRGLEASVAPNPSKNLILNFNALSAPNPLNVEYVEEVESLPGLFGQTFSTHPREKIQHVQHF